MDLRQLHALLAVVDQGSFSKAARALHTVQSNVSAHVANLEKELGAVLLDRDTGRLTDEGAAVVARARRIQTELEALRVDVASLGLEVKGTVHFGVIGTTARWLVPGVLEAMRDEHPKVRAVVVEGGTTALVGQLLTGRLEVAVVNFPVDNPEITASPLFEEDLMVVAPEGHPLAGRDVVDLPELEEHPLLLSAPDTPLRLEIDEGARRNGVVLQPLAELDGVGLMASLAFQGFGPAVLPATAVPVWLSGPWRRVQVRGLPRRRIGVARRRRVLLPTPAHVLTVTLRKVVGELGSDQPGVHLLAPAGTEGDDVLRNLL